ncbi:MAG: carbohydrate ABC transporter permease [Bacilli bacterium]|jgi:multiple sugar transport system permease protein|nr:carbohydrate ABC transporter permease [Bacilli bacterium]
MAKKEKAYKPSRGEIAYERHRKSPEYAAIDTKSMTLVIREGNANVAALEKAQKTGKILSLVLVYAFLIFMALIVIFPFYWMIITSLKSTTEIRATQQTFFPEAVLWSNYVKVFQSFDFVTYLRNTLIVGIISTLGTIITTIFAAFAFARLEFKGRDFLFAVLLATMMIPGEMMVITNYITVANFGWLGNVVGVFTSMIVPFWVSVFYIYLLRQNFKQIPNELYLAAKVDGKSDWSFLWQVMVPLASPTIISIFILKLMGSWNSYVWPNLVASKQEWRLITNGLRSSFTSTSGEPEYGLQMAATVLVTVPLLLLFIFFRKYIMKGVGRAGIKG